MAKDRADSPRQKNVDNERDSTRSSPQQPEIQPSTPSALPREIPEAAPAAPHRITSNHSGSATDIVASLSRHRPRVLTPVAIRQDSEKEGDFPASNEEQNMSSEGVESTERTPGDVGSVVNATPLPLTPGPHRRELGISPVRLTPTSNINTPSTPIRTQHRSSSTPLNGVQESLVLWGTAVNMDDAEARLTKFLKGFRIESNETDSNPVDSSDSVVHINLPTEGGSTDRAELKEPETGKSQRDMAYYIDQLTMLSETGDSVLNIDMCHVQQYDSGLYRKVRAYPNELITVFDAVATSMFKQMFPEEARAMNDGKRRSLQVRTFNLLPSHVQSMRELNPSDISTLVAVRGMIIRASPIIPDIQIAMYSCSKCRALKDISISHGRIDEPRNCNSCNSKDSFTLIHSRSTFSDKQMVRLQEAPESIPKGETPSTFTLVMYDSLVDTVKPGDRVEITGILRANPMRVNPRLRVVRSVFKTYIDCVHIQVMNNNRSRPEAQRSSYDRVGAKRQSAVLANDHSLSSGTRARHQHESLADMFEDLSCHPNLYEKLSSSLAPSIFGMSDEKKGILLQLFGGADKGTDVHSEDAAPSRESRTFRSSINILLVGDPGTSKSQLLHSAHRLSSRGVYTSGRGSSAVGLTAYVTKDPESDDYVLESGALVLSDRGLCCIDEFDKMSDFARSVLHEAMEQQTVSVAKAGIIATLNARTAVLAAANPVNSRYDISRTVVDNIDLPPTLLSRFDLIYLVVDTPCADSDRKLARHIVSLFFRNYDEVDDGFESQGNSSNIEGNATKDSISSLLFDGDILSARTLTDYIAYARKKVNPTLSDAAAEALVNAYVDMRSKGRGTENVTATPRQLESLIRLAEAHARMYLKAEADTSDVSEAVRLVQSALRMAAYDPLTGKIDMNLFTAGKGRESSDPRTMLAKFIIDLLQDLGEGQSVRTAELVRILSEKSETEFGAGDLREALRQLEQAGKIVYTNGGQTIGILEQKN